MFGKAALINGSWKMQDQLVSSILIEETRTKTSYFFLKCTLKKTKQKK